MVWLRTLAVALALLLAGQAAAAFAQADWHSADTPWRAQLNLEQPKGEKCIKETDWMRKNHMDFLKKQREITVREGIRVKEESLLNCRTCHQSRENFCDKCHDFNAVKPDCFECHNYP